MTTPTVAPGQTWADKDPRELGRTVRVDSVDSRYAYCVVVTGRASHPEMGAGRATRIALDGMPKRFSLVGEL